MRTIKFRGKVEYPQKYFGDKDIPNGMWIVGDLHVNWCYPHIHIDTKDKYPINPYTIGQFTGLHDKNGKEIYEGDIIRLVWTDHVGKGKNKVPVLKYVENCPPKVISYRTGAFGYVNFEADEYSEEEWLPILDYPCEVIGNIHDNPELLKGK